MAREFGALFLRCLLETPITDKCIKMYELFRIVQNWARKKIQIRKKNDFALVTAHLYGELAAFFSVQQLGSNHIDLTGQFVQLEGVTWVLHHVVKLTIYTL